MQNQQEIELLECFRQMSVANKRMTLRGARSLAAEELQSRPKLRLIAGGRSSVPDVVLVRSVGRHAKNK